MFEAYYRPPLDPMREQSIEEVVKSFGGEVTFREYDSPSFCLTCEFAERGKAELAETKLRERGEHTEGVQDYDGD